MSSRKNVVSPYCATCKKAGEPENVYLSHFTKDTPGGKVTCPTIKNFRCKECGESGHIANEKYCPVMRERCSRISIQTRGSRPVKKNTSGNGNGNGNGNSNGKKKTVESISVNRFAVAFDHSSDTEDEVEDDEVKVEVKNEVKKGSKEEFPVLASVIVSGGSGSTTNISFKSYKDMLEKPVIVSKGNEVLLNFRVLSSYTSRVTPLKMATSKTRHSWASDTSSDEEYD
jgi:hypothetical protein